MTDYEWFLEENKKNLKAKKRKAKKAFLRVAKDFFSQPTAQKAMNLTDQLADAASFEYRRYEGIGYKLKKKNALSRLFNARLSFRWTSPTRSGRFKGEILDGVTTKILLDLTSKIRKHVIEKGTKNVDPNDIKAVIKSFVGQKKYRKNNFLAKFVGVPSPY